MIQGVPFFVFALFVPYRYRKHGKNLSSSIFQITPDKKIQI